MGTRVGRYPGVTLRSGTEWPRPLGALATVPEQLAEWNPLKFGKYPPFGCHSGQWQSLPKDAWNDPAYISGFDGLNSSCWPDGSNFAPSYIPTPYPSDRVLGGAVCSWSNPQVLEVPLLFGDCFAKLPRGFGGTAPRPAPRAVIAAERLWGGASAAAADVLTRVGCAFWETAEEVCNEEQEYYDSRQQRATAAARTPAT